MKVSSRPVGRVTGEILRREILISSRKIGTESAKYRQSVQFFSSSSSLPRFPSLVYRISVAIPIQIYLKSERSTSYSICITEESVCDSIWRGVKNEVHRNLWNFNIWWKEMIFYSGTWKESWPKTNFPALISNYAFESHFPHHFEIALIPRHAVCDI